MSLSIEDQAKLARITGSFMYRLCSGTAIALKGAGYALEKSSGATADALRTVANGIENAGTVSSNACYNGARHLNDKAAEYQVVNQISDEELMAALAGDEDDTLVSETAIDDENFVRTAKA